MSLRIPAVVALLTLALAGCGKMGALERPGPLFGKAGAPAPATDDQAQDPSRPVRNVDPRDRSEDQSTRAMPAGAGSDPFAAGPLGASPEPTSR